MKDEKTTAFAHFDALKARFADLHAHAARIGDTALTASIEAGHQEAQAAWTDYLDARGWGAEATTANRSGGEDKPPKPPEPGEEEAGG